MTAPRLAAALALLLAAPAHAELDHSGGTYLCDRGVTLPASYINASDGSVAVLYVEGRLVTLPEAPSASGARYAWPSDGAGYVWWTKGDTATLYWRDLATGDEQAVYATCTMQE